MVTDPTRPETDESNAGGPDTEQNRTGKILERFRYKLMWIVAPVAKETVEGGLKKHVETWDESEYDSGRMLGNLLGLWRDRYFETGTEQEGTEDER